ncbi:MAG: transglutaminase domain-containing protein [Cytophagales bacterium]|jgi:hypothetical protein|nr:transglutaminase domain-containing protein [Cytophagales bacterium]
MIRELIHVSGTFLGFLFFNFISITRWEQTNNFTKTDHQNVQTNVEICAKNLQQGQFYKKWTIFFDSQQEVKIENVLVNGERAKFFFDKDQLDIDIGKLSDQQTAKIKINYNTKYDKSCRDVNFIKRDFVSVPEYAKGAKVKLMVKIPKDFVVYSDLNFFKKNKNGFLEWEGVLQSRFGEEIGICLKEASWKLNTVVSLFSENIIKDPCLRINLLYAGGNNHINNFFVTCNGEKIKYKINDEDIIVNPKSTNSCFQKYEFKAEINNCYKDYFFDNSLISHDEIPTDETTDFSQIVKNILSENKSKIPVYVKICRWVNKYLQYDLKMAGKKIGVESIIAKRRGVCEHYAVLFKRLMQELKIPCLIVSGLAYSLTYKKFIPHAWNVIFIDNKWIPLDPTWNISSGIVPVSHIFIKVDLDNNSGIKAKVNFKNSKQENKVTMNIQQKAEFTVKNQKG